MWRCALLQLFTRGSIDGKVGTGRDAGRWQQTRSIRLEGKHTEQAAMVLFGSQYAHCYPVKDCLKLYSEH